MMTNISVEAQRLIEWIHGARAHSKKVGLSNMRRMLKLLGNPEAGFRSIHVAGTNGKGSVCQFIERALRENGYRTGLYTSPYLVRYQERMRLNGQSVQDELFVRMGQKLYAVCAQLLRDDIRPTAFELGTALAFLIFNEQKVDFAVIEVGLGGRLDPTNVLTPMLCVIANIGLDHTDLLGDTIAQIAAEKAGILKSGVPAVLYPSGPEAIASIQAVAANLQAAPRLWYSGDHPVQIERMDARGALYHTNMPGLGALSVRLDMPGRHQLDNAQLALCALAALRAQGVALSKHKVLRGMQSAVWPGRLQWIDEHLLLDGAHNEQGAQALAAYIRDHLPGRRVVLLTAMMRDKRPEACAKALSKVAAQVVATQVDWPRALTCAELGAIYAGLGFEPICEPDTQTALTRAQKIAAQQDGIVLVCGSLYLVGAVLGLLDNR